MTKFEMKYIEGNRIRLRLVRPDDALYINSLRMDVRYNAHLSAVSGTVEDQRAWIEEYKLREASGAEYYYIIENRLNNRPCGVVRLYDLQDDQFTWGSWILDENKPKLAALESAVLVYRIGFEILDLRDCIFDVRNQNERTLGFHRRFGAVETSIDNLNYYFQYSSNQFFADRQKHLELINKAEP